LEISGNKNNLKEQFEDKIAKNVITAQPQPKVKPLLHVETFS